MKYLVNLRKRGIEAFIVAGKLRLGPQDALTPGIVQTCREHSRELMAEIAAEAEADIYRRYQYSSQADLEAALTRLYRSFAALMDPYVHPCSCGSRLFWKDERSRLIPQLRCYDCAPPPESVVGPAMVEGAAG